LKYLFIIALFAVNSFKKEKDNFVVLNQSFTLAQGAKACLISENICLIFEKVYGDSRCPLGAMCFWE